MSHVDADDKLDFDDDDHSFIVDNVVDAIDTVIENAEDNVAELATAELEIVLSTMTLAHHKNNPTSWVNAVLFKLSSVGINNTTDIHEHPITLNQRHRNSDFASFHRTTLAGLSKSWAPDFRHRQV